MTILPPYSPVTMQSGYPYPGNTQGNFPSNKPYTSTVTNLMTNDSGFKNLGIGLGTGAVLWGYSRVIRHIGALNYQQAGLENPKDLRKLGLLPAMATVGLAGVYFLVKSFTPSSHKSLNSQN